MERVWLSLALLDGGLVGEAVEELEGAEAGFHLVRRRDGRRNVGGHLVGLGCSGCDEGGGHHRVEECGFHH
jgi:hypothetical protein